MTSALRREELPLIVALGAGGLALVQWSCFFAIHRFAIGVALVIQFVGPILVTLWALRLPRACPRPGSGSPSRSMVELWQTHRPNAAGLTAAAIAAVTYATRAGI